MTLRSLKPGDSLDQVVLVSECQAKRTKKDTAYWSLVVRDKTASLDAKCWSPPANTEIPIAGNFVRLIGTVEDYRGEPQLNVTDLTYADPATVQMADFLPCSERPAEEMHRELVEKVRTRIQSEPLKAMLIDMLTDEKIKSVLLRSPAAARNHHAKLGGLLEHILSLWWLSESVAMHYDKLINRDLLLAYCVVHDFGKTKELSVDLGFSYTPIGDLVGHVIIGAHLLWHYTRKHKLPVDLELKLLHGVSGHHGEFGDIKPQTMELQVFHWLDQLDASVEAIRAALAEDTTGLPAVMVPMLRREFYR
jgi:3'-5' exoribonuclease